MRINKYLASIGIASRREVDRLIDKQEIFINKEIAKLGQELEPGDIIEVFDNEISFCLSEQIEKFYLAYNKPVGIISSCSNEPNNIIDAINFEHRVFPIGRLDKESRGLILLSNDGALCHKLTHPSFAHEKEYEVECQNDLSPEDLAKLGAGLEIEIENSRKLIEKVITQKAQIERINPKKFRIILKQGYKRQIRLMVKSLANRVIDLYRVRIDNVNLSRLNLPEGEYKRLKYEEFFA